MSRTTQSKVRSRSRGQEDDDDYCARHTSRPITKKSRSSSTARRAHRARNPVSRNLTRQDLQEWFHVDFKQSPEPHVDALQSKHCSPAAPAAPVSASQTKFSKPALPSLSSIPSCSPLTWASTPSASSSNLSDPSSRRPVKADPRLPVSSLRARRPTILNQPRYVPERLDPFSVSSPPQTRQQQQQQQQQIHKRDSRVSKRNAVFIKPKPILKTAGSSSSFSAAPASRISMPTTDFSTTEQLVSVGGTVLPVWPTPALAAASPAPTHASDADIDADSDVDIVIDAGIRPSSSTVYTVHAKHGLQPPASVSAPASPVSSPDASHPSARTVSAAKEHPKAQSVASLPEPGPVAHKRLLIRDRLASIGPSSRCSVTKGAKALPSVRSEPASSVHILYMPGWDSAPSTPSSSSSSSSSSVSRDPRLRTKRSSTLTESTPASPTTMTAAVSPIAATVADAETTSKQLAVWDADDDVQHIKATLKSEIHINGQAALHLALVRPKDLVSCVLDIDTTVAEMEQHLSAGLKIARDVWCLESQPDSHGATQGALWLMLQNTTDTQQSPVVDSDAIARSEQCSLAVDNMSSTADRYPHFKDNLQALPLRWSIALAVPQTSDAHSDRKINGLLKFIKAMQFSGGQQHDVFISLSDPRPEARPSFLPALSFTATSDTSLVSSQGIASCTSSASSTPSLVQGNKPRPRSRFSSLDDHGYFSDLSDADQHRTPPSSTMASAPAEHLKGKTPICHPPVSSPRCFIDLTVFDDDDDDENDDGNNTDNNNRNSTDHEQWVPKTFGRFFDSTAVPTASTSPSVPKQEQANSLL
ncbi:hypothetical protein EC968_003129 [Mortierella alpina]|nr:hypothetical protein EC968_003129 [Mortierella alpina]